MLQLHDFTLTVLALGWTNPKPWPLPFGALVGLTVLCVVAILYAVRSERQ
jgi:hypothetical protein